MAALLGLPWMFPTSAVDLTRDATRDSPPVLPRANRVEALRTAGCGSAFGAAQALPARLLYRVSGRIRLQEYESKTAPVRGYYEQRDMLKRIDANDDPDAIFGQVEQALREFVNV